ncbi:hypothetical protein [Streptomyces mirabilis]|uniref:hypothetical protein n=1 Tax=Streptomyces mirabilis TaxID=68239 RepID=UPI0033BF194C
MRMPTAPMVCHVLLVETAGGLVLVDSGYGLADRSSSNTTPTGRRGAVSPR